MTFPFKIIDLTQPLSTKAPAWDGDCGFQHETVLDYASCTTEVKFKVQKIHMYAGLGTHMDAAVHQAILGAGKYIVENVANSSKLPPRGSFSLALPIPIKGATEAPMRFIGLVQKNR